ncbi:MAG TPA: D-amino acid dehydrogenase [Burkholderiales bacterium]|nr:D-amino acid dehydrogenase [Burkholderiales bacterium]
MRVMVLGAGVVGTASAWYLARRGHEVSVIERQGAAGLETSFANGGQISASHAEPWAEPGVPAKLLQWFGREDAPLVFRPRAEWRQWAWGARFLYECLPFRNRENTRQILALALYSRDALRELRRDTGIEYDQLARGILAFHTDEEAFERAAAQAALLRRFGSEREVRTAEECIAIEPALRHAADRIVGGIHTPGDESGDACKFTQALARLAAEQGVRFDYGRTIKRLEVEGGRVRSVVLADAAGRDDPLVADAYVVALGSYSPLALAPLGVSIPVYPLKGYSITVPLEADDEAPTMSLTDVDHKLVFSRLGDRLRVAGTAEMDGYNTDVNDVRCEAIVRRTFDLFPGAGHPERAEYWTGLRPATPSNVPCVGRTRYPNLFLNTGHGTLGWTMACGSGRAIADIVSGRVPEPDFCFTGMPPRSRGVLVANPSSG